MCPEQGEKNTQIGFCLRTLSHMVGRTVQQLAFSGVPDEITGIQGWIMGYLYDNRDRDVFQRDIQTQFSVSRSTVTGILQTMEKKGLIVRESVDWDARLKRLSLTKKAMQHHEKVMCGIHRTEELLAGMLTAEERSAFLRLCEKLKKGIEALEPKNCK